MIRPAVDGPVLEDARGDGVCRAGRVTERGIVVLVKVLLFPVSAPHPSNVPSLPAQKWHATELITPTCPASSVQWVGGSKPVSSPVLPAASPAASPDASPADPPAAAAAGDCPPAGGCAGGCAGGDEVGDGSLARGAGGVALVASPGGSLLAIVDELQNVVPKPREPTGSAVEPGQEEKSRGPRVGEIVYLCGLHLKKARPITRDE